MGHTSKLTTSGIPVTSSQFRDFLEESTLSDIQGQDKVFLLVIGGSASGKNYIFDKNFTLPLVDVDAITKKLSGGDFEKAQKMITKAIKVAGSQIEDSLQKGKSIAQVTTGVGAKGVENKFKKAKAAGFTTALILVDTPLETALERNKARAQKGKQGLIPDWKVEKTNRGARDTFKQLRGKVDLELVINN